MKTEHPITPPPELVQQWWDGTHGGYYELEAVAIAAARWGWDQRNATVEAELQQARDEELEACCGCIESFSWLGVLMSSAKIRRSLSEALRAHRRSKPPSLKEQVLKALYYSVDASEFPKEYETIRRALETLPE